ncbi:ATP synthase F1 subcomplex gamma subunit [Austwickia chelonae]|uniref:ATP synthase gamma chain n=1 Tax=Austwickia chelonae NBRC 105200 TaxID=1184607 RepID=K6VMV7_9MICO|nr:F0F1 ATP synthase subunit gamma [Austwickia chelonae]GAB76710.1 ATP synthase subunit gamma [Austwickia chelonae NBRC 105200]SEW29629.1 ATP synthase F1 subcomplex gamma subunit [Austwickia chelonae]
MGAQIREYRQRIRSVKATQKITKAMELMAASRVIKARQRVEETTPYAVAITEALGAVASHSDAEHPLTTEVEHPRRAAVLIIASNQGLAGGYISSVLKESERLVEKLRSEGKEVIPFLVGRKTISFYRFRHREYAASWDGSTDNPTFETAKEISDRILQEFLAPEGNRVDEVHIVYTQFRTMVTQVPRALRLLPIEVVDEHVEETGHRRMLPLYEFEPSTEDVLDAILPQYVTHRVFNCLLQSAASELAARQRAMKSATDNADELIKTYTRLANQARQAQITQEISEIVGGANALADAK